LLIPTKTVWYKVKIKGDAAREYLFSIYQAGLMNEAINGIEMLINFKLNNVKTSRRNTETRKIQMMRQ